jgi:hypothetical protein
MYMHSRKIRAFVLQKTYTRVSRAAFFHNGPKLITQMDINRGMNAIKCGTFM